MKKITLITFLILTSLFSVKAQNTFYNSYSSGSPIYWYYAERYGNGYNVVGMLNKQTVWAHTDSAGNFANCTTFPSFPFSNVWPLTNNSVLVASTNGSALSLLKLNGSGNTVWSATYSIPSLKKVVAYNAAVLNRSGNICLIGSGKMGTYNYGFVMETDSNGNLLKNLYVSPDTTDSYTLNDFGSIAVAADNSIIIAMNKVAMLSEDPNGVDDIIKLDSALNVKWVRANYGVGGSMIIRGNRIVCTYALQVFNLSTHALQGFTYLTRLDTSGNVYKTTQYGEIRNGCNNSIPTPDGGEIGFGSRGYSGTMGVVAKFDTGENVLWSRYYVPYVNLYLASINSVMPANDGGYIMTCTVVNSGYQLCQSFIIKTDSLGFQGCTDSTNTYTSSVQGYHSYNADSLIFSTLSITQSANPVTSSVVADTIVHYCYNGIPTSVNVLTNTKPAINVYPNPSNGLFVFQANSQQLLANSRIEVFNVLGRKIYSESFSIVHSPFSINLSTQPAGIYLYRITDESGKMVSSGKLMIEK